MKYSVPISIETIEEHNLSFLIEQLKNADISRVFLTVLQPIYHSDASIYTLGDKFRSVMESLRNAGLEIGIWLSTIGHGSPLAHEKMCDQVVSYQQIVGINGKVAQGAFCPLDKNFADRCSKAVEIVARLHPDIIMLDDDYRLNVRMDYAMGCLCPEHMKRLKDRLGEDINLEQFEQLCFSGGKNRYRDVWMDVMGETLREFAEMLRLTVNRVDSSIRLGICTCYDTWDYDGSDNIELAKTFAGRTHAFLRTIGPPYAWPKITGAVEMTRMQAAWCKDSEVEVFAEGDVYPRPRYNVPSKLLELYDFALLVTGEVEGCLKYMYCYDKPLEYEQGYIKAHLANQKLRREMIEIFENKKTVGVRVFEEMHKMRNWNLPEGGDAKLAENGFFPRAQRLLAQNSIPTTYEGFDAPLIVFGENARHLPLENLKYGAILDVVAANILKERGVDTGLISSEISWFDREQFINDDFVFQTGIALHNMNCKDDVKVLSHLLPGNSIGSYLYENKDGKRFYVLAADTYGCHYCDTDFVEYYSSYYRQKQLQEAITWIGRKPLPITCEKHPMLYIIASQSESNDSMSVGLFNIFPDDMIDLSIKLNHAYNNIRFVNCDGKLDGDNIIISRVEPYGISAFEVF